MFIHIHIGIFLNAIPDHSNVWPMIEIFNLQIVYLHTFFLVTIIYIVFLESIQ